MSAVTRKRQDGPLEIPNRQAMESLDRSAQQKRGGWVQVGDANGNDSTRPQGAPPADATDAAEEVVNRQARQERSRSAARQE